MQITGKIYTLTNKLRNNNNRVPESIFGTFFLIYKYMITRIRDFSLYLINERAVSIDDIYDGNVIPIIKKFKNEIRIALYNTTTLDIHGFCILEKWHKNDDFWTIGKVVADQGYGPLVYDIAMQTVNPEYLCPSATRVITREAINIWKYYDKYRSDVKKAPTDNSDIRYASSFKYDTHGTLQNDPETLRLINTKYSMNRMPEYNLFIQRGADMVKQLDLDIDEILDKGYKHYDRNYRVQAV